MDFLEKATKELEKSGVSVGSSQPPRYWLSTGNHVLNKVISGSFKRGIGQGRMISFAGPAQSGKSFLIGNAMREAQKDGQYIVVVDSENALDDDFVGSIGVDTTKNYYYTEANTIAECKRIVSKVIKSYKAEYGDDEDAPKMFIAIDSLDMLMTETEEDNFEKGVSKGDQGQRSKQLKQMLREFVQSIKHLNIIIATTSQVYKNQDPLNGEGLWIITEAVRFAPSQIVLITKLKLRDSDRTVSGIRMKCEGFKTRFTKPFQSVTIEVPYETGMDRYNGLTDVAVDLGVLEKKAAWKYFGELKWNKPDIPEEHVEAVLEECEKLRREDLLARVNVEDLDLTEGPSSRQKRKKKATGEE